MKVQRYKGSRDLLPDDIARFRYVEQVFRSCCQSWGYDEIRTPTLEYLHLFTSTGTLTPSMLNKVYSFLDWDGWSGERVVLRPEGTIPAARLYIENSKPSSLAKLFYVENIFSFEETGKESRERWQCGVELIGSDKPSADVELILLALETLERLGIKEVKLCLSHAGLIKALLRESGLTPAREIQIFDRILDGDTEIVREIIKNNPQLRDSLPLLFELRGKSPGFLENLKVSLTKASPNLKPNMENFITIAQLLTDMGCKYQIDIASGKGFEYYTGIIFQVYLGSQKLGGGGRYDDLIPLLGGSNTPASGFAIYIDQLMSFLPPGDFRGDVSKRILVRNGIDEFRGWKLSFEIISLLQEAGYIVEFDQGYEEVTEHRWIVKIQEEGGRLFFLLTDQVSGKNLEANSPTMILSLLQGTNANKAGPS